MFSTPGMARAALLFALLHLAACSSPLDPETYPYFNVDEASAVTPSPLPDVSFALVRTGDAQSLDAFAFEGGSWTRARTFVHSAVLVTHPRGDILFDTGLGREIDTQFREMPAYIRPLMRYRKYAPVVEQLQAQGYDPARITRIYLSHMHWDHASGIEDFPGADIYLHRDEHRAANDPANARVYLRSQFDADGIRWRHIEFIEQPYLNYPRSHDLYGDGSIVFVPMGGHSPGSVGMFLNLTGNRRFFFTGDVTWSLEGFRIPARKFALASMLADDDRARTSREVVRVHRLMHQLPDLVIIPAHDDHVQAQIGYYPKTIR